MAYYTPNGCCKVCGTCPSDPIAKVGTKTATIFAHLDANGTSTLATTTNGCSGIPLKSGGSLSLSRYQLAGQGLLQVAVGIDQWLPAGATGVFGFLPFLTSNGGQFGDPYVIYSDGGVQAYTQVAFSGSVTYYASDTPLPVRGVFDSFDNRFTEINAASGLRRVYAGLGDASLGGRILKRTDVNANTVYYNYSSQAGGKYVLRKLTGDLGGMTPYFNYLSETGGAPITKMVLRDNAVASNSRSVYFDYDVDHLLTKVTFPGGCTTSYQHAQYGVVSATALLREVDSEGNATYFEYGDPSNPQVLRRSFEPAGRTSYFDYPAMGTTRYGVVGRPSTYFTYADNAGGTAVIQRKQDVLLQTTYYEYTTNNLKSRQIDPNGNTTYYEYDVVDLVMTRQVSAFNGATTYYKYMPNNQDLRKVIGPRNVVGSFPVVTYYQYDANRNRTIVTDALGNATATIPDGVGRIRKQQDARLNTTYFNFDATVGRTRTQVDPLNQATYFGYDSFANQTRMVSPRWQETGSFAAFTTYHQYDSRDRRTRTIDALGQTSYFSYTSRGDLLDSIDPRGVTTENGYSALRLLIKRTITDVGSALVQKQYFTYDVFKNRTRQMDPRSNWTYFFYDVLDRQTVIRDALGNATYYVYDAMGNCTQVRDARANTTYYAFDQLSRQTTMRDALGDITGYGYDLADNQRKVQDARNNTTYYSFDALNRVIAVIDALNGTSSTDYDAVGNRRKTRDQRLNTTYFTFDALDRQVAQIDALNNLTYFGYDAAGNRVRVRDARQNATDTRYDVLNRVTAVRDANGKSAYFAYDPVGNQRKMRDQRQNTTYFTFDALNRTTTQVDAVNSLTYFEYDANGNRTRIRDARLNATTTRYDVLDRVTAVTDAIGNSAYFGYDAVGNRRKAQDRRQNTTYFTFDAVNRVTATVDAANGTASTVYDPVGNITKRSDELAHATYFAYDALNRPIVLTNHLGNLTYYAYDAAGNRVRVRDQVVTTSYFFYDALNRASVNRDGLGQATYFFYDGVGNRTGLRNARAHTTYFAYDPLNRLAIVRDAVANLTYFGYDAVGNRVVVRDGLFHATASRYDAVNRLTAITDALSASAYFGYDAVGNRLKEQDQRQNTTYFSYDALNRLSSISDPLGATTLCAYDAGSNLHGTVDNNGLATYFQYDALNRRTRIIYGGGTAYAYGTQAYGTTPYGGVTIYGSTYAYGTQAYGTTPYGGGVAGGETQYFTYDAVGNLTTAIAAASTTSYRYDALNRVTRKTSDSTSAYFTYVVRGDNQSFLDSIRYPGNVKAYYTYDAAHALSQVTGPTGTQTTYVRNALSKRQKQVFGNNTRCYYTYDNAERLTSIRHLTSAGVGIAYFDYQYDAANRITRITRLDAAVYYAYDNADRLTAETWRRKSTGAQLYGFQYRYDAAGNRIKGYREAAAGVQIDTAYYVYDAANALTKRIVLPSGTLTYYSYDANGSVIKIYEGTNATYFTYGPHQLVTSITPPVADGQPWSFAYDGQLSRRKIVKAGVASYYLWNGMNQLEERNAAGTLTVRYTHGDPIVPGMGSVVEVQQITPTTTYFQYLHMDHQGSVAKITDAVQATQIAYQNDAFGRQIVPPTGTTPTVPNDLVFQSNWITSTVGAKRYGISPSRIYDFETGRFLSRDPLSIERKLIENSTGHVLGIYGETAFRFEFFGFHLDQAIGLSYNRPKYYNLSLSRLISNDQDKYFEESSLYANWFVPNRIDPFGLEGSNYSGVDDCILHEATWIDTPTVGNISVSSNFAAEWQWGGFGLGGVNIGKLTFLANFDLRFNVNCEYWCKKKCEKDYIYDHDRVVGPGLRFTNVHIHAKAAISPLPFKYQYIISLLRISIWTGKVGNFVNSYFAAKAAEFGPTAICVGSDLAGYLKKAAEDAPDISLD